MHTHSHTSYMQARLTTYILELHMTERYPKSPLGFAHDRHVTWPFVAHPRLRQQHMNLQENIGDEPRWERECDSWESNSRRQPTHQRSWPPKPRSVLLWVISWHQPIGLVNFSWHTNKNIEISFLLLDFTVVMLGCALWYVVLSFHSLLIGLVQSRWILRIYRLNFG